MEDLGIDGRIDMTLNLDLGCDGVAQDVVGACEQSNDRFSFVKGPTFLRCLSDYKLLTNNA